MARQMKDSGIEWIGEIPETWEYARLKNWFAFEKGKNAALYTQEYLGEHFGQYPVYSGQTENQGIMGCIDTYDYDITECLFTTTVGAKVMTPRILHGRFNLSQNCLIMHQMKSCCMRFFYYALLSLFDYEKSLIPSYMQPSLRIEDMRKYSIYIPNLTEQYAIADFLDRKCAEIDAVIERTKATIEEYKKLKQAVITEAVTKGVRGPRPMKDSGIEWIGEIPEEWEVNRIKYVSNFEPGCSKDGLTDRSIITYTPMDCIKNGWFINNTATLGSVSSSLTAYQEGDIVMAKVTPCFENGNIAIMCGLASGFGLGSSELFVIRPTKIETKYMFYWLRNTVFMQRACATMTGTGGLKRVSPSFVRDCFIHMPPSAEQAEIAAYLDEKCAALDTLIAKKAALLTELETYKKSLIYEYVTGKKEVTA